MFIGIDLGGTNIRVATVQDGQIVRLLSEPSLSQGSREDVQEQMSRLIEGVLTPEVEGIGIGVPSVVDCEKGIVFNVVGIPSWKEVHLKNFLENRFHLPVAVNNDCNCFALGVARYGSLRHAKETVCVTLGTGVGSSLVVDGRLYNGHNTGAGEIGSIPYLDKDYEYYCSSRFFTGKGTTGKEAAASGPSPLWEEFGTHVGKLVQLILYAYDPEAIVIGGSIAKAFPLFSDAMWKETRRFPYPQSVQNLKIAPADVENAGILGAALLLNTMVAPL
ncbi:MAG: ROK family protein [Bacteroidales bacterium]|nr:ROK family protein [Bacteroidales bacterium]